MGKDAADGRFTLVERGLGARKTSVKRYAIHKRECSRARVGVDRAVAVGIGKCRGSVRALGDPDLGDIVLGVAIGIQHRLAIQRVLQRNVGRRPTAPSGTARCCRRRHAGRWSKEDGGLRAFPAATAADRSLVSDRATRHPPPCAPTARRTPDQRACASSSCPIAGGTETPARCR